MLQVNDHEMLQGINLRWYKQTQNHPPVLQYIERGEGMKNGEPYYIERWAGVPLFIGDDCDTKDTTK
jgi:hypothetical protein